MAARGSVDTARVIINADKVQASAGATGTFTFTSAVSQRSCGAVIVLENAAAPPAPSSGQSSMTRGGALRDDLATILY